MYPNSPLAPSLVQDLSKRGKEFFLKKQLGLVASLFLAIAITSGEVLMKKITTPFFVLLLSCSITIGAETPSSNAKEILANSTRPTLYAVFLNIDDEDSNKIAIPPSELRHKKSVTKAVFLSAAIPGAGEFYAGSFLKGVAFLVVEAAAITGHIHFQNRGTDLESEFENFADANWVEDDYWQWMADISPFSRTDMDSLRAYERENFSHFLPEQKNQQYYENIGKYDQFNIGWNDTNNGGARDSANRTDYSLQRKNANDNFKRATNWATLALFNHVISALDASFTTKRYNRGIQTSLKMRGLLYDRKVIPAVNLRVKW